MTTDADPEIDRIFDKWEKMTPVEIARENRRWAARERKRRRDETRLQALCLKRALSPGEPQAAAFASALGLLKLADHAGALLDILFEHFASAEALEMEREKAAIVAMTGEDEPPPLH